MQNVSYQISASQASEIFKLACNPNEFGFSVTGSQNAMTYEGIQKALGAFYGFQMHNAEVNSRLSDFSEYGSDRRQYVPQYKKLSNWYAKQYNDQSLKVNRLGYQIAPNQEIERLFKSRSWKS